MPKPCARFGVRKRNSKPSSTTMTSPSQSSKKPCANWRRLPNFSGNMAEVPRTAPSVLFARSGERSSDSIKTLPPPSTSTAIRIRFFIPLPFTSKSTCSFPPLVTAVPPRVPVVRTPGVSPTNLRLGSFGADNQVLTAFQQVEDQLAALRILDQEVRQQDSAVKSSERF